MTTSSMIATLLFGFILGYVGWILICLEANAHKARGMHIPVVRLPFDTTNVLWLLLQPAIFAILD